MEYKLLTDSLQESWKLMLELEDKFMYHSNAMAKAEKIIFEATQLYFDTMELLENEKDYEHYDEFNTKFRDSYAFMTSNYFMFKIKFLKEGK